jgi:hypothetical protein
MASQAAGVGMRYRAASQVKAAFQASMQAKYSAVVASQDLLPTYVVPSHREGGVSARVEARHAARDASQASGS